jgi:transposase
MVSTHGDAAAGSLQRARHWFSQLRSGRTDNQTFARRGRFTVMAAALVPDGLWDVIEPLLPLPKPKPQGGRPRIPDRACLRGILFVLRSGVPWEMLPKELGCGSGMTCWRRLRDWQESGIWQLIHYGLLDWLCRFNRIDWSRAVVDSCSVRAVFGGSRPAGILLIGLSSVASVI